MTHMLTFMCIFLMLNIPNFDNLNNWISVFCFLQFWFVFQKDTVLSNDSSKLKNLNKPHIKPEIISSLTNKFYDWFSAHAQRFPLSRNVSCSVFYTNARTTKKKEKNQRSNIKGQFYVLLTDSHTKKIQLLPQTRNNNTNIKKMGNRHHEYRYCQERHMFPYLDNCSKASPSNIENANTDSYRVTNNEYATSTFCNRPPVLDTG